MAKLWPILFTTDSAAAPALAYRMLALSVRGGPSADLSRAHRNLTISLAVVWPPAYETAARHGRLAVEAAKAASAPLDAAIGMLYTSDIYCWSARYREALPWLDNARSSLTVLGNMWELANTHIFSFLAFRGLGKLDDALAHARSLAEIGEKLGARSTVANGRQKVAEVLLLRGERLEAETHLGASLELADRAGFNFERFNGRKLRGLEALQNGDCPAARDAYDAAIRIVETKGVSFFQGYYGDAYLGFAEAVLLDDDLLARAGLDGDDGKRAAEYVARWRRRETRLRGHLVTAWRVEGLLRARQRQARAARQAFERAIALAREQERPVELAAALASAARWSDARPETRRSWLHEARAICERLGLAPLATDVRRQLTDLGEVLALPADAATQPGDARALEAMTSLIATTELLMQTRDVELLLERIAVASATLLKAERALIFLADADAAAKLAAARDAVQMPAPMGAPGSLPPAPAKMTFHLGRTLAGDPVPAEDANVTHTVIDQVQARRRGLAISNTGDDEVLRERRSVLAYQVRSVLCVPLLHAGQVLGVLYVDSQITQMLFGDADLQLLQTFATQAAIALASARQFATIEAHNRELDLKVLDRTRALETANQRIEASLIELRDTTLALAVAQREALEKELEVARQIQLAMVPGQAPITTPGAELAGYLEPATQCGGDLWTYAVGGSGQVLLFVGDVTGHGTGSAMIATVAKACIDTLTLARDAFELDGLARTLHAVIASSGKERLMMTAFAAVIDPGARALHYVTAGHLPQFLVRAKTADQLHGRSTRLGDASTDVMVTVQTTTYEPGDRLVLFTDGITERTSPDGEEYGNRRLRRVLTAQRAASPAATRDAIIADVEAFAAGTPSGDDVTIVIADLR
jgi:serine phosphatase RsbU (regulator of sigma subunit)